MSLRIASPKILIIRLDGLGDTLLTLPLLDGLKAGLPGCEITYFASERGAPVFAGDHRIDRLWVAELAAMSCQERWQWGRRIRAAAFDVVFCLNEKFWPAIWAGMSGATVRLGFDPGWLQTPKALLRRLTLTDWLPAANDPALVSIHEVERYAGLASLLPASLPVAGPLRLQPMPEAVKLQNLPGLPVALHLSAKWLGEGWPPDSCLRLANSLLDRFPELFLLVTAGPGEEKYFAGAASVLPPQRYQLLTQLPFGQWAGLLRGCRALVSMDTGAVHLAAAVGTPVVDVFPQQNFAHASSRWAPWRTPHRVVRRPGPDRAAEFTAEIHAALEALL